VNINVKVCLYSMWTKIPDQNSFRLTDLVINVLTNAINFAAGTKRGSGKSRAIAEMLLTYCKLLPIKLKMITLSKN